ncbi:MAG: GGDEF domain-containing protein [Pseudomonadota bacterium]
MNIDDILAKRKSNKLKSISPDRSIMEMADILASNNIGSLAVTDKDNRLIGIASERDIVKAVRESPGELTSRKVSDIMTKEVITCTARDGVRSVLTKMNKNKIRHIPVVEGDTPVTMISVREFEVICNHLQQLAWTDELTGLPNRRFFMEAIDIEFSKYRRWKQSFSIAMLDLDHFKSVNDTYGHDIGDRVLVSVAEIFQSELRAYDVVGRLGGEEFGILFPGTDANGAVSACEHVNKAIRACKVDTGTGAINFTASIGIAEVDTANSDTPTLIKKADEMLYLSKDTGRDKISFDSAIAA